MCPDFPPSGNAEDIWSYTDRQLTEITGVPRTDLFGEDSTFENGSGVRKMRIDRLSNILSFENPNDTSVLMDGTEKTLILKEDSKFGYLDGYVDLTPMVFGDRIVLKEYMQIKSGGSYVMYANATFRNSQKEPLIHIVTRPSIYGIKVTAHQIAGSNITVDAQFYRSIEE